MSRSIERRDVAYDAEPQRTRVQERFPELSQFVNDGLWVVFETLLEVLIVFELVDRVPSSLVTVTLSK